MLLPARATLAPTILLFGVVAGCGDSGAHQAKGLTGAVEIDGSSTVKPITEAVAEEFQKVEEGVRVAVGVSGTGGGFKRFTVGETDISNASRPIKAKENQVAIDNKVDYIEIPVAYDGLTIVVNKNNDWCKSLNVDQLKKIFLSGSTVSKWSDIDSSWPDIPVKIYAPGVQSGTFDYFKEVVAGKTGSIRDDMEVSEDDNILVRGVSGEKGGIGFFGCAYFYENEDKLKAVPIDGGNGPVMPTSDAIENGTYSPFSRPLFIYVNAKSADKEVVQEFVNFYLDNGGELASEVGYVRLPSSMYDIARANFESRKTGTQFLDPKGEKVHGPLPKVYR